MTIQEEIPKDSSPSLNSLEKEKRKSKKPISNNTLINSLAFSVKQATPGESYSFKHLFKICKPLVQSCYIYLASTLKMDAPFIKTETISTFYELTKQYDETIGVYFLIYIKRKLYPLVKYRLVRFLKGSNKTVDIFDNQEFDIECKREFNWTYLLDSVKLELGDLYSDILFLRYLSGLTQEEIGNIVGVSQVIVFTHLRKIYDMIRGQGDLYDFLKNYEK